MMQYNTDVVLPDSTPQLTKPKTVLQKRLLLLNWIVFIIAVSLVMAVMMVIRDSNNNLEICLTPICINSASTVFKYMDTKINPCENFYQFACGNYLKEAIILDDQPCTNNFLAVAYKIENQLKAILDTPLQPKASKSFQQVKILYNLCMNTTAIEENGLRTITELIEYFDSCPLFNGSNWDENNFKWTNLVYKLRQVGATHNYFIDLDVSIDEKNTSQRIITIDQSPPTIKGIADKTLSNSSLFDYIADSVMIFGANPNIASDEIKNVLEFQMNLNKVRIPDEGRKNLSKLYNPMTIRELQYRLPKIDWMEYINNIINIPNITLTYKEIVIVRAPQYFRKLTDLLEVTPKRVQANYVIINTIMSIAPFLTDRLRNRQKSVSKPISEISRKQPRWRECVNVATRSLGLPLYSAYVKKHSKNHTIHKVDELLLDIREELAAILKNAGWFDENTKKLALEKMDSITTHTGYPVELLDDKNIDDYYDKLKIDPDNYLNAILSVNMFIQEKRFSRLREIVNKTDWVDHSITTVPNAYYSLSENSIQLPLAVLQDVFFDPNRTKYINYGTLGYLIGHEIVYGFDDTGGQFDKEGNIKEWWSAKTKTLFLEKAQCIIDQYSNYTLAELSLTPNGINTHSETLADRGGIKQAYLAYSKWIQRNGPEQQLPGLQYTSKQMFWISAAQLWCFKCREEHVNSDTKSRFQTNSEYRVIGTFGNSIHFSNDFNCPLGTPMNPELKCNVW